ncbi:MAG: hypothetical protein ACREJN_18955 [Nitrospiraceae bacterium]
MLQTDSLESAILQELARGDNCSPAELASQLPGYPWTKVFSTLERLAREGTVSLNSQSPFRCVISLAPRRYPEARHVKPV